MFPHCEGKAHWSLWGRRVKTSSLLRSMTYEHSLKIWCCVWSHFSLMQTQFSLLYNHGDWKVKEQNSSNCTLPTSDLQDCLLSAQQAIRLPLLHHLVIICVVSHCHWAEPLRGEPTSHYRDSLIHDAVSDGPEGINKQRTTPFLND